MRWSIILFVIVCICNSLVATSTPFPKIWRPFDFKRFMYQILTTFLKKCDLNMRKIIIWDDFYYLETSLAMADIQPETSVTIIRNLGLWRKQSQNRFDDIEIDAVILVIDMREDPWPELLRFFLRWRFKRNSIVYIFPKQMDFCLSYKQTLLYMMRFYFAAAYYICVKYNKYPLVYTQDPYGDIKPAHWTRVNQNIVYGKVWTHYGRACQKDLSEFCPGFNFTRTDPNNQNISVGIPFYQLNLGFRGRRENQYGDEMQDQLIPDLQKKVKIYKKLLKLRFNYITLDPSSNTLVYFQRAFDLTSIDAFILNKYVVNMPIWWQHFHPIEYEPYVIISHSRGFMTPFEKIAKYYGVWTLSSLTIILIITFIAIWFATKKIYLASFDVIRLLINAGIIVPINNPNRKIFFSMIFLYFLIIHATFSGHLAEFLTSVDYRPNIETLEDLKNPSVEKIFTFGYIYDSDYMILRQKTESLGESYDCHNMTQSQDYVCIAPLSVLENARLNLKDKTNALYISKEKLGIALVTYLYRPGFPLAEKINRAIMFTFDTTIVNEDVRQNRQNLTVLDSRHHALITINYRKLTVKDIYFAFIFLIVGNCMGIVCFLFEVSCKKIRNKNDSQHLQRKRNILFNIRCCAQCFEEKKFEKRFENIYDKMKTHSYRNSRNTVDSHN